MAVPKGLKQIGWFVGLWAAGVGVVLVFSLAMRMVLMPG